MLGLLVLAAMSLAILSIRPGGLRQQLRLVARRFRIVLVLGGIWTLGSVVIRFAFPTGPVSDYGSPVIAILLGVVFLFVGRDPDTPADPSRP